jgi:RIO-like serine/threonine protein kinase
MQDGEASAEVLKSDLFGRVERVHLNEGQGSVFEVRRDTTCARWWLRPLARHLAAREALALPLLQDLPQVPRVKKWSRGVLVRTWKPGSPMQQAQPTQPEYFAAAFRLLVQLHRRGVAHNDLAKEPNWLVDPNGLPALVDFQLASVHPRRGWRFRLHAREDIRHLLKHKRTYCPGSLTEREKGILARPSFPARLWRLTGKRIYLFVTRICLGWADREGAEDRNL